MFRRVALGIVRNRPAWSLIEATLGRLSRLYGRLSRLRKSVVNGSFTMPSRIERVFASREVVHGPFRGMKYSSNFCSHPKRLGSYEAELHETINILCACKYDAIINIGCGAGYYAVGMALRNPHALIYAFDTNPKALEQCRELAEINGVSGRMRYGTFCSGKELESTSADSHNLIISDCEGYEHQLFTEDLVRRLMHSDFLVETHDFVNIGTTQDLLHAFSSTHAVTEIESIDDVLKAYRYKYAELDEFDLPDRFLILSEGRPRIMRWLVARSLSAAGNACDKLESRLS